jgi:hypothetical protein
MPGENRRILRDFCTPAYLLCFHTLNITQKAASRLLAGSRFFVNGRNINILLLN